MKCASESRAFAVPERKHISKNVGSLAKAPHPKTLRGSARFNPCRWFLSLEHFFHGGGVNETEAHLRRGVRMVAILEVAKGVAALVIGFGLLSLVGTDLEAAARHLVRAVHLNPDAYYPSKFIDLVSKVDESWLFILAGLVAFYVCVRFVEGYGLWHMKAWAEWLGILSGGIYLPFEIVEFVRHLDWLIGLVMVVNAGIVGYLIYVRFRHSRPLQGLVDSKTPSEDDPLKKY